MSDKVKKGFTTLTPVLRAPRRRLAAEGGRGHDVEVFSANFHGRSRGLNQGILKGEVSRYGLPPV
jgi:hypothetical protein